MLVGRQMLVYFDSQAGYESNSAALGASKLQEALFEDTCEKTAGASCSPPPTKACRLLANFASQSVPRQTPRISEANCKRKEGHAPASQSAQLINSTVQTIW